MDFNPLKWDWNEKKAAGRHALNTTATILATVATLHLFGVTAKDATDITESLTTIWDGLVKVGTGIAALIAALTPIYTALKSAHSASPPEQIKSVVANLSAPQITQAAAELADPGSRNKLISAVAEMPEVRAIVTPESVAANTESSKVVSTPAAAQALPLAVAPPAAA